MTQREKDLVVFAVYMMRNNNDGRCISNVLRQRLPKDVRAEVQDIIAQPNNGAPR